MAVFAKYFFGVAALVENWVNSAIVRDIYCRCFLHLLEGELGLVGLFGDGGDEGLFLGGTAEEENYFFQHGKTP